MKKIKTAPRSMIKNPDLPVCPKHRTNMTFDRSDTTWKCRVDGCRVVARRKDDSAPQQQFSDPNQKFSTHLEVITLQDGEENYLLATTAGGKTTIIDVTDHIDMVIDEHTNSVTLCLLFNDVKRTYL